MFRPRVKVEGIEALVKGLNKNADLDLIKKVVKTNGAELDSKAKRNAVFTQGYATGQTKRSISTTIEDGGLTSKTKPSTEYSVYVEYGTRKMAAQPFMKPAFNAQKEQFKKDIKRLV